MNLKTLFKFALIIPVVAGITACETSMEVETKTQKVELGQAEFVSVEMSIGAGELNLEGGASDLMDGTFRYHVRRWRPEVDYRVVDKKGRLIIRQRKRPGLHLGRSENSWDIRLNNRVPMDLAINLGAGSSDLNLRDFALGRVDIDMGIGELTLDLSGERKENVGVKINGGIGSGTIYLPENIGVRAQIEGGIGSVSAHGFQKNGHVYTNDAYGKTTVSINVRVEAGIGSIELKLR